MLIGKKTRRISNNLIISKYFEEENNEIHNQYFVRNVADELSIISLGFGGFFALINPCSFDIEYSSDTFCELEDVNLVEVPKFVSKAATVFRIEGQSELPKLNIDYIKSTLSSKEQKELSNKLNEVTGANEIYTIEYGSLGTTFESIELNVDALNNANYAVLDSDKLSEGEKEEQADELASEIAKRKRELELLNEQLAGAASGSSSENILRVDDVSASPVEAQVVTKYTSTSEIKETSEDFFNPTDLFANIKIDESNEGDKNV